MNIHRSVKAVWSSIGDDAIAEAYATVSLVEKGWVDPLDVARAFGQSERSVRCNQRRCEAGGLAARLSERLSSGSVAHRSHRGSFVVSIEARAVDGRNDSSTHLRNLIRDDTAVAAAIAALDLPAGTDDVAAGEPVAHRGFVDSLADALGFTTEPAGAVIDPARQGRSRDRGH